MPAHVHTKGTVAVPTLSSVASACGMIAMI